jgi:ABC-2 type transport system ATP-binding protein
MSIATGTATGTAAEGAPNDMHITFANVSRFYGEVLGINNVSLTIPPGITSLVGPNGSGKTTLMNLMTGLIHPSQGEIRVLGISPEDPERLCRAVGYCAQFDAYPKGLTGYQFIYSFLRMFGFSHEESDRRTMASLETVGLVEARNRPVAAYSKGMRQRAKLAQATAHDPQVVILDEPLNGLDPLARAEAISLFEQWGKKGRHVIVSSHILHEVDRISDQVILLSQGYVVAEGQIQSVRGEVKDQPMQILVRCDRPGQLAAQLFQQGKVVECKLHTDGRGLLLRTTDAEAFYLLLNKIVIETGLEIESVAPADDDVNSVYQYLIGGEGATI